MTTRRQEVKKKPQKASLQKWQQVNLQEAHP